MPNAVKYSTSSETLALKKGNFYIATGDVDKGTTSNSGYWNGITPPTSGYTIYLNKASNGPSIYVADNDSELISLTNLIAGANYSTKQQCFEYFNGQTDKLVLNNDISPITTNGLILNLDASTVISYPMSGSSWNDISLSSNNFTLFNGVSYSANTLSFDGSDDYASITNNPISNLYQKSFTVEIFLYVAASASTSNTYQTFVHIGGNDNPLFIGGLRSGLTGVAGLFGIFGGASNFITTPFGGYVYGDSTYTYPGKWTHIIFVADYTNNYTKTYINGTFYTGTTYNGTMSNQNNNFFLGRTNGYNEYLSGNFSAFRMYNRALTESEISLNYESTAKKYSSLVVQSLVVAGGGGGGSGKGGGGGAGGLITGSTTNLITNTNYTITVGGGGAVDTNGSNSVFNTITSNGGGFGGRMFSTTAGTGGSGGGAGGAHSSSGQGYSGGTPISGQGYKGGGNYNGITVLSNSGGAGGGGASMEGYNATETSGTTGGDGIYISEYSVLGGDPSGWFAGGGGGGAPYNDNRGFGGKGGGGQGAQNQSGVGSQNAYAGTVNTGGGGGGASIGGSGSGFYNAKAGGSGIVILRIPDVYKAVFSSGVGYTETKSNGYKYYKVTATSTTSETVYFT